LNIRHLCPSISAFAINCYRDPSSLFIDGSFILSQEGTTQGDPLAMPLYALATVPLIKAVSNESDARQVWYADDSGATGKITSLHQWWESLLLRGPSFGYYVNRSKTWLIVKEELEDEARSLFSDFDINITTEGRPYLGSPIGTESFIHSYVKSKVDTWLTIINTLSEVALPSPHAAYAAFTHGISSLWTFLCRTTPDICHLLEPLELLIRSKLIPTLTGQTPPNDLTRRLLALPSRLGGINFSSPTSLEHEYGFSTRLSAPLSSLILDPDPSIHPLDIYLQQVEIRKTLAQERKQLACSAATTLLPLLSSDLQLSVKLAQEKGASSWLIALPLRQHGFALHKSAFRDALALRYGWIPKDIPSECPCGKPFHVEHALSCTKGGFPTLRHNEIRDLTASLLSEVCSNVSVEPPLQNLSGEHLPSGSVNREDGARADIAVDGFWGLSRERTYFDVRVFNPYAPSNKNQSLASSYRNQEKEKKRHYSQRINVIELGSFTPIILSSTGGYAREATVFYKRLASLLSESRNEHYNITISWLRCIINFSLLRSSIQCIRGARSSRGMPYRQTPISVIHAESRLG
jgi:hypothetical protein